MARFELTPNTTSGRRGSWYKTVDSVDPDGKNGYAISGEFLDANKELELPTGTLILEVRPRGSVKNSWKSAHAYRLQSDGSLEELPETAADHLDWRDNFLSIRDALLAALGEEANPLAEFGDDEIRAEAERRGLL